MPTTNSVLTPGVYRRDTAMETWHEPQNGPSAAEFAAARATISRVLAPTPTVLSTQLSRRWGRTAYVKYENISPVRSFKIRGALAAISALTTPGKTNGAITASTGNHGQALAFAGHHFGVPVTVVVPKNAETAKVTALRNLGASLEIYGGNLSEAQDRAQQLAEERGALFVEDGEHLGLMAGAGSLIAEMLEQAPELETVIVPVGGGNLIASTLAASAQSAPQLTIVGVQSSAAPGATESWLAGDVVTAACRTIAGGLATEYPGQASLQVMIALLETMILVSDDDLWRAIGTTFDATGAAIEAAGVAGIAAIDCYGDEIPGEHVGIMLTGGWISRPDLVRALSADII